MTRILTRARTAILSGVCILQLLDAASPAQVPTNATFDVASIKPSPADDANTIRFMGNALPGGRWNAKSATLEQMIRSVYPGHSLPGQLTAGPKWVRSTRWDITARAANEKATSAELVAMAKRLLADRFHLTLRTQPQEVAGYALVMRRPGSTPDGLHRTAVDCEAFRSSLAGNNEVPASTRTACIVSIGQTGPVWRLQAGGIEMTRLASLLTPRVGAPVVDATGLKGQYDLKLEYATDTAAQAGAEPVSIVTALQEQLGLRLKKRRVPLEVLVIDRAELPEPN